MTFPSAEASAGPSGHVHPVHRDRLRAPGREVASRTPAAAAQRPVATFHPTAAGASRSVRRHLDHRGSRRGLGHRREDAPAHRSRSVRHPRRLDRDQAGEAPPGRGTAGAPSRGRSEAEHRRDLRHRIRKDRSLSHSDLDSHRLRIGCIGPPTHPPVVGAGTSPAGLAARSSTASGANASDARHDPLSDECSCRGSAVPSARRCSASPIWCQPRRCLVRPLQRVHPGNEGSTGWQGDRASRGCRRRRYSRRRTRSHVHRRACRRLAARSVPICAGRRARDTMGHRRNSTRHPRDELLDAQRHADA